MAGKHYDAVIVGGGASGLAAAAELGMSSPGLDVLVLEKNVEPGRKIRATGSGRCNITNTAAAGYTEILKFFRRIGLMTRVYENGLVYPYSESAADVAALLISRAEELGVCIVTGAEVTAVTANGRQDRSEGKGISAQSSFEIRYSAKEADRAGRVRVTQKSVTADYVILALGGKAGPTYGTKGDGYRLARELGHSIVTPVPVLTSVECREWDPEHRPQAVMLAGTRTRGVVSLYRHPDGDWERGVEVFEEPGEIQFTKYGLSGICVFNMTRFMRFDRRAGESLENFVIRADLFPDGNIREFLRDRRSNAFPGEKTGEVLRTVLKDNIAAYVLETAGGAAACRHIGDKLLEDLNDAEIDAIGDAVHELTFHPVQLRGWKEAQATSGGVSLEEIDEVTGESRLVRDLYITGELADRDFPCGGFNLSNAWLTGIGAARDIHDKIQDQ